MVTLKNNYMNTSISPEFKKLASTFGPADKATLQFRKECKKRGFKVVFSNGIPNDTILEILSSIDASSL